MFSPEELFDGPGGLWGGGGAPPDLFPIAQGTIKWRTSSSRQE